jgi:hypothetical protein
MVVGRLVDGSVSSSMSRLEHHSEFFQIALEDTVLDAAKSSIVFNVTKAVSTPGRAVRQRLTVVCNG